MNKKKLRVFAASLGAVAVIAGISAYFTSEDTVTNAFVASTLKIQIVEEKWIPDKIIVPEKIVDKDPKIKNIDETSAYVFMEVTVPAGDYEVENNNAPNKGNSLGVKTIPLFKFVNKSGEYNTDVGSSAQTVNSGWYLMEGYPKENKNSSGKVSSYSYLYAYTGSNEESKMAVLDPNELTNTALFDKVIFANVREGQKLEGSTQSINIKAYAVQTAYLESPTLTKDQAEDVWEFISK